MVKVSRVPALDGIRALGIVLVLLGHGGEDTSLASKSHTYFRIVSALSHLGVDVFFVLSGFLITSLILGEMKTTGGLDLKSFYLRRLRRIFPAYYAFLVIIGICSLAHLIKIPLLFWFSNVLFLTDYSMGIGVWWSGHAWSLAVEEQYYLIWPITLAIAGAARSRAIALCAIAIVPLLRVMTYFLAPSQRDNIGTMFHTRVDVLLLGSLLALIWANSDVLTQWPRARYGNLIAISSITILISGVFIESRIGNAYRLSVEYDATGLSVAALINYVIVRPESIIGRFFGISIIGWLGRISYSIYLWQQPFMNPYNHGLLGAFPYNLIATLFLSVISYYFIERRFFSPKPITRAELRTINASN